MALLMGIPSLNQKLLDIGVKQSDINKATGKLDLSKLSQAERTQANFVITQDNYNALLDDLSRLPFMGDKVEEGREQSKGLEISFSDLTNPNKVEDMSESAAYLSGMALQIERTILGPRGLVVLGGLVLSFVGLGFYLGKKKYQK